LSTWKAWPTGICNLGSSWLMVINLLTATNHTQPVAHLANTFICRHGYMVPIWRSFELVSNCSCLLVRLPLDDPRPPSHLTGNRSRWTPKPMTFTCDRRCPNLSRRLPLDDTMSLVASHWKPFATNPKARDPASDSCRNLSRRCLLRVLTLPVPLWTSDKLPHSQ
jgi:hypothetical protein